MANVFELEPDVTDRVPGAVTQIVIHAATGGIGIAIGPSIPQARAGTIVLTAKAAFHTGPDRISVLALRKPNI
jgi:hypothetical protein